MARRTPSFVMQRLLGAGLLLVCAAVALWLVLAQQHRDSAEASRAKQALRLFDIASPDRVTHITLETPSEGVFELVRDGDGDTAWHLVTPRAVLAEASTIEAMLKSALALEQTQTVALAHTAKEGSTDLSIFGLSPPHFRLALTTGGAVGDSSATQALAIGKRNSFDGSLFVQREDAQTIAIVPGDFLSVVDRNLYKLRDKRVALMNPARIERLVVGASSFGPGYTLERDAEGFKLRKPLAARADTEEVDAVLTALTSLRGKSVVAESARETQLALFGLQTPRFVVQAWLSKAEASEPPSLQIYLGELQMRGVTHIFARTDDPAGPVWELGSDWIMQKLRQDAHALRDMRVVHIAQDKVAQITMHQHTSQQSFVRKRAADGEWMPWQLSNNPNQAIHPSLVTALVARVVELKADRIVDEHLPVKALKTSGLHKPRVEIDLLDEGAHLLGSVLMGAEDKDGVFVTTDRKERLDHITRRAHDDIAIAPATFLDNDATP